ncbi:MAG: BamA/TamA family outer membrane protein [Burkholderiales bacterium]
MVNLFRRSVLKMTLGLSLLGLSLLGLTAFDQLGFAQTVSGQPSDPALPAPSPKPAPQGGGLKGSEVFAQSRTRNAPLREEQAKFNLGSKHLNAVTSSLQSAGVGFGFGFELTTADALKWVEFRLQAAAMPNLHHRLEASAYLPRLGDQRTHAEVWVSYGRRLQDNFFGVGPRYPKTEQTNFDLESRSFNASVYREFARALQAGAYLQISNSEADRGNDDRDIPIDRLFSGDRAASAASRWAPGLSSNAKILSYGVFAEYDRRSDDRGLTRGAYFFGRVGSADGLEIKNTFSDYGWTFGELDGRVYIPLGSDKRSLALRGYSLLQSPKGGSQIPFYNLAWVGGGNSVRGFQDGRFRGHNSALFSAELRKTVWTGEEGRRLDVFAFGDTGQVWGDNRSKTDPAVLTNKNFDAGNWRSGIGGGLQYRHAKGYFGRIQVGHSNERTLVYISISRGF